MKSVCQLKEQLWDQTSGRVCFIQAREKIFIQIKSFFLDQLETHLLSDLKNNIDMKRE